MSKEEQRKRVMAWAHETQRIREQGDRHDAESYADNHLPDTLELIAVLLAQETELAELSEQRQQLNTANTLLRDWVDSRIPLPELSDWVRQVRAHLDGPKAGWSEVLGILNDGSTPRESDELEPLHPSLADSAFANTKPELISLQEVTQKFIDAEAERRAEYDAAFTALSANFVQVGEPKPQGESITASGDAAPSERVSVNDYYREVRRSSELRQRVAELEAQGHADYWAKDREAYEAEITRLREALDVILKASCGATIDIPAKGFEWAHNIAHQALYGAKGVESEADTSSVGHAISGDDSNRGSHSDIGGDSPTPLSEPLELHYPMSVIEWRAALRKRDAEIAQQIGANVAAIAEFKTRLEANVSGSIATEERRCNDAKEVVAIADSHYERMNKMQRQVDSLWERTDIYVDLQEKQQEQIDAINKRLDEWEEKDKEGAEGIMRFIRMETERLDALEEAVLMSLQEHKADKQGMVMWGSGDFERMANKLREGKGGKQ